MFKFAENTLVDLQKKSFQVCGAVFVQECMMRNLTLFILILNYASLTKAQSLNWFASAHAGASNYKSTVMNGALLGGFENESGNQLAAGPVIKGFMVNGIMKNQIGARMYSQISLTEHLNAYLQCDLSGINQLKNSAATSPMRVETGAGLSYMLKENIGFACGYSFGEYNPYTNQRKNSPALKLIYLVPFSRSGSW